MNLNEVYNQIVELEGDCFNPSNGRPLCRNCPFVVDCLSKIIQNGSYISKESRVKWALDKLIEEFVLNDDETH